MQGTAVVELQKEVPVAAPLAVFTEGDVRYHILKFLFLNGSCYPAQIAKKLELSRAWVSRALKEMHRAGYVEATIDIKKCSFCHGDGHGIDGKEGKCVFCEGRGEMEVKSYPIFYRVPDTLAPHVLGLIRATVDMKDEMKDLEKLKRWR